MSITCVTGYWNIKNKHGNKFEDWFENTLAVNNPYIIFSDKEGIESMKKYRNDLPTHYIEMDIDDIIDFSSFEKGMEILGKYNIVIDG